MTQPLTPAQITRSDQIEAEALDRVAYLIRDVHDHRRGHGCDGIGDAAGYALMTTPLHLILPVATMLLQLAADQGHVEHVLAEVPA